jgi:C1A family cysteine protease
MIWPLKKKRKRGMGWIRDPHDPYAKAYYMAPRAEEPPPSVSLKKHVAEILDQGEAGSCVAHAFAYAIMLAESMAGLPYDPISRRYLYSNARAITGDERRDVGTYLVNAAKSMTIMGAAPESSMPYSDAPKKINEIPGLQPHMLAHPRRGVVDRKILAPGKARINAVKRAFEAGHPVTAGFDLEESFEEYDGDGVIEPPSSESSIIGGHALCMVGYDEDGPEFVNSWNTTWGDAGFGRFSWDYITSPYCSDLHIVTGWQRIVDAFEARGEAVA